MRALAIALTAGSCFLGLAASGPQARAAPVVKVRARTEIHIDAVKRMGTHVEVNGRVVDVYSQDPVPMVFVTVRMNDLAKTARTDEEGIFSAWFEIADGRHDVSVEFAGEEYYEGDADQMSGVDVRKQGLELQIAARDVSYSNRTIEVIVKAGNEYGGAAITATIFAGPVAGELTRVGSVTTEADGRGVTNIERKLLGGPGRKRLRVRFAGDRTFNPAEAHSDFLLATATAITLRIDEPDIAYESELRAGGRVVDDLGNPVANGPVALVIGARRLASALTAADGSYRLGADGDEIGAGTFNVQAVFEPAEPWYQPGRSEPARVEIAEPQPVPVTHTLAAFGATALAMAAFLGLRSKPWEAWLARLRRQRASDSTAEPTAAAEQPPPIRHGLQPARPGLVSTLRRPNAFDFTGTVRDAVKGRPIPGVALTLTRAGAGERSESSDSRGRFAFDELEAGEWTAVCVAHGYVSERFTVAVPHRGELRDVHVDLVPVRERIFSMYREVAEPMLPNAQLWGIWTPRQIFDHVRRVRPVSALSRLTDFVEDTYFSQRIPSEQVLPEARGYMDRARAEVAPVRPLA